MTCPFLDYGFTPKNNDVMVVFQNLPDLSSIKIISFEKINKIFTNIKKVIHLDVNTENIIISKSFDKLSINIIKLR